MKQAIVIVGEALKAELQALLNTAWDRHVTRGKPLGFTEDNNRIFCSYLKGCAVGCNLNPSELIEVDIHSGDEGSVQYFYDRMKAFITSFNETHIPFLSHLQTAHDNAVHKDFVETSTGLYNAGFVSKDLHRKVTKKGRRYYAAQNYKAVAKLYGLTTPS